MAAPLPGDVLIDYEPTRASARLASRGVIVPTPDGCPRHDEGVACGSASPPDRCRAVNLATASAPATSQIHRTANASRGLPLSYARQAGAVAPAA